MELRRYFAILRNRLLVIIVTVLVGLAVGYATTNRTPRYSATATIYVGSRNLAAGDRAISNDVLLGLQRISATFSKMITSYPVAADAVARAKVPRTPGALLASVKAAPESGTQLLRVQVTDTQPQVAQQLTNAVVDSFVEKIATFEPGQAQPGQLPTLPAYVFEHARLPVAPKPSGLLTNLILDGGFGFVFAVALVFLLEYLDVTIKSAAEAERRLELPVLGVIPLESRIDVMQAGRAVRAS
jgi:capsular polysaccharide biosynthesis protein